MTDKRDIPATHYPTQPIPPPAGPPPPYSANPLPPVGFQVPQQTVYVQQTRHVVTNQPMRGAPVILVTGGNCPACRAGILRNEFTCCGIFMAICFFPLGIFCCLLMTERRCSNCGLAFA
ncbi:hypothetical protein Pcinc_020623 [Petrolisthes cinctipes]|uniref:Membrane protein BRI3 n=1 Tax=Petrolisthes cinctipes TaxID=88211 RepID=A0AAE1FIV2_PETCI|nr:hypothetical protein Pcinc_020623 [Petrolisthes cinctipes]